MSSNERQSSDESSARGDKRADQSGDKPAEKWAQIEDADQESQGDPLTAFSLPMEASEQLREPADRALSIANVQTTDQPSPALTRELFEKAVAAHSRRLLAIARAIVGTRASPEDVVQQAVMNLFQHRDRYDWREPGGLLKRAVVNESLRLLRPPKMSLVSDEHPDQSDTPVAGLIENETVRKVREAIAKLPDHFRAALVLCEYEKLSYVEIAQTLNASVPQVKTWLHRARRQLAKMLGPYIEQDRTSGKA